MILDRESGIKVEEDDLLIGKNDRTYLVEFLSKGNVKMAKLKHLLTADRFSTEFMITYAVLDICFNRRIIDIS